MGARVRMDDLDVLEKDPTGHAPYLFGLATLTFADGTDTVVDRSDGQYQTSRLVTISTDNQDGRHHLN